MKSQFLIATIIVIASLQSFAVAQSPSPRGAAVAGSGSAAQRVLVVVGPSSHPPGSHEVAAGGRLVAHCLNNLENAPAIAATVSIGWPAEDQRTGVDSVVFIGDMFPPMRLGGTDEILADLTQMMDRGCGIVCLHYANGLEAKDVGPEGQHPLLGWMGGYFATRCEHHRSVARIFEAAKIEKASPEHPVSRGWKPFTLHDEPYINNYFGPDDNRMAAGVLPFATSMLPPEDPQSQIVAWGIQRQDGGRGFGIVMPHFYRSWKIEDLRKLILNGIVWTAKQDVPPEGVVTTLPRLERFDPESIVPIPRRKPNRKAD